MTRMLASVTSLAEAQLVFHAGVDIIDLKQPSEGALGALDLKIIEQICTWCAGRIPVSATVGDLPMQPDLIGSAVQTFAASGVDYIKIGFFPDGDWPGVVQRLSMLAQPHLALIAVLFADTRLDREWIQILHRAGFKGVMLDTMDKRRGSLTHIMHAGDIEAFTQDVKKYGMLCGLAGSLQLSDISSLLRYRPDYLGFRGALCTQRIRTAALDREAVARIKNALCCDSNAYQMC
ncbi:MAG: (5-formylfuran-3-yl)methyl phosphate synthase [Gammaproteobacteria bacterium]